MEAKSIPKFVYVKDNLTIAQAKRHHYDLLQKMHALALSAQSFVTIPSIFDPIREEYKILVKFSLAF